MTKRVLLKRMFIYGFRGFNEGVQVDFNDTLTQFLGDNGEGKTSLGEAISWVFTGKSLFGGSKNLDILNLDADETKVVAIYEDENQEENELERRLRNGTTTVKFNGKSIKQEDLDKLISFDSFLTSLNPMYFLGLASAAARKKIVSLFPPLTKEDILNAMSTQEREFLEKEMFQEDSTNTYLENRAKEKVELEDGLKHMEGYIDKVKEPIVIPVEIVYDATKLSAKRKELEEKLMKRPNPATEESLEKELTHLREQGMAVKDKVHPEMNRINEIDNRIKSIVTERGYIENEKFVIPDSPLPAKRDSLLVEHKHTKEKIIMLQKQYDDKAKAINTKCPTCNEPLKEAKVKELQAKQQAGLTQLKQEIEALSMEMNKIKENGTAVANEIKAQVEAGQAAAKKFESEKQAKLKTLSDEEAAIGKERDALKVTFNQKEEARKKTLADIVTKGQTLAKQLVDLKTKANVVVEEFNKEVAIIRQEIVNLEAEEKKVYTEQANRNVLIKKEEERKAELTRLETNKQAVIANLTKIQNQIFYMKSFAMKRVELLHAQMEKYLNLVKIRLQKHVASTGELKDCFEIEYDGKPISVCSLSERMRAGMEISGMIGQMQGSDYPMFLDNAESITSYKSGQEQVIEVQVSKGVKLGKWDGTKVVPLVKAFARQGA